MLEGHIASLTSRRLCPSFRPAFSTLDPGCTEEMKMPLALPPTSVTSDRKESPGRETSRMARVAPFPGMDDDREGRKGLKERRTVTKSWARNADANPRSHTTSPALSGEFWKRTAIANGDSAQCIYRHHPEEMHLKQAYADTLRVIPKADNCWWVADLL